MNLIDLVKLNNELDEMIARQDEEVKRIDAEIEHTKEMRYRSFMDDMEKYSKITESIDPTLNVFVGSHNDGYGNRRCVDIEFNTKHHRLLIRQMTTLGDSLYVASIGYRQPYNEATAFGNKTVVDSIVSWYYDHPYTFEENLTNACVRATKEKAEKANARMIAAEERRRNYEKED